MEIFSTSRPWTKRAARVPVTSLGGGAVILGASQGGRFQTQISQLMERSIAIGLLVMRKTNLGDGHDVCTLQSLCPYFKDCGFPDGNILLTLDRDFTEQSKLPHLSVIRPSS